MRIQILILGFKHKGLKRVNCIISEPSFCLHLDECSGMEWKIMLKYGKHLHECTGN